MVFPRLRGVLGRHPHIPTKGHLAHEKKPASSSGPLPPKRRFRPPVVTSEALKQCESPCRGFSQCFFPAPQTHAAAKAESLLLRRKLTTPICREISVAVAAAICGVKEERMLRKSRLQSQPVFGSFSRRPQVKGRLDAAKHSHTHPKPTWRQRTNGDNKALSFWTPTISVARDAVR